jgi:uncharacterized circularly permuted ATP-grasp superfamily protein
MKNIHVLPTPLPSRLVKNNDKNTYALLSGFIKSNPAYTTQHIYITNDEEIKEGDWVIYNNELQKSDGIGFKSVDKKVILTTDQDLIADGIEQISENTLLKIIEHINSGKNIESFDEL